MALAGPSAAWTQSTETLPTSAWKWISDRARSGTLSPFGIYLIRFLIALGPFNQLLTVISTPAR